MKVDVEQMLTNDTGLLQSIFMFGGAPSRLMINSVERNVRKNNHRATEVVQRIRLLGKAG